MSNSNIEEYISLIESNPGVLEDIKKIKEVFPDKERLLLIIKILQLSLEKPENKELEYSKGSNPSYYKPKYAYAIKKVLDELINPDGSFIMKDILFEYVKLPGISKSTLYLRILVGWKYLLDCLDPNGIYLKLRNETRICKEKRGVAIRWKVNIIKQAGTENLLPSISKVNPKAEDLKWKAELEEFIHSAINNQIFKKVGLELTDGQIIMIQGMLKDLPGFVPIEIERNKIVIMFNEGFEKYEKGFSNS